KKLKEGIERQKHDGQDILPSDPPVPLPLAAKNVSPGAQSAEPLPAQQPSVDLVSEIAKPAGEEGTDIVKSLTK
ncbi:MAG: hypothetical protein JWM56_1342, partial [Candidatus Peribacteria bacterium]|nr:hypothetical protein [Candidatus Peribacteria bacterium]